MGTSQRLLTTNPAARLSPRDVAGRFARRFGGTPRLFQAPGRINIIGEHTDYCGGLAMPAAIDRHCLVAARPNGGRRLQVIAATFDEEARIDLDALIPRGGWSDYVAGVAQVLMAEGLPISGADLWIESDVPVGGGVSSSAALEVAIARALLALAGCEADGVQVARWAQTAENRFVGMPCGIMDQFASANGVAGGALLLDCATLAVCPVRLPEAASFLLIDSMVRHTHVDGEYRRRREDCEAAARILGVERLGEVERTALPAALGRLPPRLAQRCRHVVTETDRVRRAAKALGRSDLAALGALMNQSHDSLRDDMEVSDPAVDRLVAMAQRTPGVLGARMMGGGFGGSVIALATASDAETARKAIQTAYAAVAGRPPDAFICRTVAGAGEIIP